MLFPRFHELHSFNNLILEFLNLNCKFFPGLGLDLPPILVVLAVQQRIIDIFDHQVEDSDWAGSDLSVEDLLVVAGVQVNFLFVLRQVSHEPHSFLLDLLSVAVRDQ